MKFTWKAVALFIAALIAIELIYLRHEARRVEELRSLLAETYSIGLALEKEIGYGGLIHNFKNYLLRPSERKYLEATQNNAEKAGALIDDLEKNAGLLGQPLTLTETRDMVRAYRDRLETISSMNTAPAREIDAVVRYTDDFALEEVGKAMAMINTVVNDRLINLAHGTQLQLQVIFALIAFGVLYFAFTQHGLIRQALAIEEANDALQKSNADLSRSNLALRQFAGIASHDLKSPVRHIALLADMTAQHVDEPEKVRGYARDIRGAAERMNILVTSLLDFTKTGFKAPQLSKVDINALIAETVSGMSGDIEAKRAEVKIGRMPVIDADPELMRRVFANLIANSLKYSSPERTPEITISSEKSPGYAIFSVADNGIGIDARHADKIFEPMQRLHSHNGDYEGAGIGLSLVRAIVESHGGAVWLDNQYLDGARFYFSIPGDFAEAFYE